ncbi:lysylphosphatidylglycerol synthase transmembrane domain-containing protein [Corynebacterium freiburgense]|uniref:lysylphosphatidylglycerol synthase transmembrane domain-containing protein n=1 Tax=Corynebacterium freiburgense TaxID=556548 RepID=UPI000558B751|nr:YbhN family protein [Corynebacterium freiburgense]
MARYLRRALPVLVIAAAIWFFRNELDFAAAFTQLRHAQPIPLILGLGTALLSLIAMAEVMRVLLGAGGTNVKLRQTASLTFAANALSTSFPGGAAISTVTQFQVMRRWHASTLLISWFIVFSGALSTIWLIALGIGAVFLHGAEFNLWSLTLPLLGTLSLAGIVWWATHNPDTLAAAIKRILPPLGRGFRNSLLWCANSLPRWCAKLSEKLRRWHQRIVEHPPGGGTQGIIKHVYQLEAVELTPTRFSWAAVCSLHNWLFDAATLGLAVWALTNTIPDPSIILLAFITSKIVGSTNLTPGGLGPVDGALIGTLMATGTHSPEALGAVILYRFISLVLITAIGWVVYLFSPWRKTQYHVKVHS